MLAKSTCRQCWILLLLLWACPAGFGQTKGSVGLPDLNALKGALGTTTRTPELRVPVPMDAPLNAAEYPVGPGDELALNIWSMSPVEQHLTVTPEGSLLIPNVGRVDVGNATLDSLKTVVARMVSRKYRDADVSLTLLTPRKVVVQIIGFVVNEGRKEVYATQRVNDLIAASNMFPTDRLTADEYAAQVRRLTVQASERRIVLRRRSGRALNVDLVKYRATGDGRYNPYLKEGDVVFVPERTAMDVQIGVYGGVMNNANFEFVAGDSLSGLIAMALGFKPNTDPEHAVLTRLSHDAEQMDSVQVNALAVARHEAPDMALQPGDRLIIPLKPEKRLDFYVTVQGEVARPGEYPVTRSTTRLSEFIRAAGGLTPLANLNAATLVRVGASTLKSIEASQAEALLGRRAALIAQDTAYYNAEMALRTQGEFVSVDFARILKNGDTASDVVLQPYDRIVIPSLTNTVYVFGQVVRPGHVPLAGGKGYKYYIDQTGGFTDEARTGDVKVVKAGTRVWLDPSETQIEDGDFVWVPKTPQYPFSYYMTIYSQVAGVLGAIATIALLVRSF